MLRIHNSWLARSQLVAARLGYNQIPSILVSTVSMTAQRSHSTASEHIPRAVHPSIWQSIVPKTLREPKTSTIHARTNKRKEWNPATFFIVIFLLIGSNAIQMIALRNDFLNFSRKADAKIGLLKEVIERVQRGEDVDVEGLLGTGDVEKEREWEEVIHEIEEADRNWDPSARRRKDRKPVKSKEQPLIAKPGKAEKETTLDNTQPEIIPIKHAASEAVKVGATGNPTPRGFY